jgi:hypothetical protein
MLKIERYVNPKCGITKRHSGTTGRNVLVLFRPILVCIQQTSGERNYQFKTHVVPVWDRLCGLVVRVPSYKSGGPGWIPSTTRKKICSGSGTGSTQPREYNWGATWWKSSGSCLENREYGRGDPSCWPRDTLYPQKSAITSPTNGVLSVGIVRSLTQTTEFVVCLFVVPVWTCWLLLYAFVS